MNRSRLLMLALAVAAGVCVPALDVRAQSPFPGGVELSPGQWVPCSHRLAIDAGRGCVSLPGVPDAPPAGDPPLVCDPLPDPYTEPAKVLACNARRPASAAVPAFLLGHVYAFGYDSVRARVVSIGLDIDGVQVVTVRWLSDDATGAGALEAFRTPPTPGGASVWRLVGGPR